VIKTKQQFTFNISYTRINDEERNFGQHFYLGVGVLLCR